VASLDYVFQKKIELKILEISKKKKKGCTKDHQDKTLVLHD